MRRTVQGRITVSLVVSDELCIPLQVDLDYDAADPCAVRLSFHLLGDGPVSWAFTRELLLDGVSGPVGDGDVHIYPGVEELSDVCIELRSRRGDALLRARAVQLINFLERTDQLAPMGEEALKGALDAQLAEIPDRHRGRDDERRWGGVRLPSPPGRPDADGTA